MVYVETAISIETIPTEQFLKLQERMRYLEEENVRTKAENAMLAGKLHDVHKKSGDADNKNVKGKGRRDEKKDEENEVRGTQCHRFRDQIWVEFQEFKKVTAYEAEKIQSSSPYAQV